MRRTSFSREEEGRESMCYFSLALFLWRTCVLKGTCEKVGEILLQAPMRLYNYAIESSRVHGPFYTAMLQA